MSVSDINSNLWHLFLFFGEGVAGAVFPEALGELGTLPELTALEGVEVFVRLQLTLRNLEHLHRHIGAMGNIMMRYRLYL